MPRLRPRISMLNSLLLMTIVAMAIVIVQSWRRTSELRKEAEAVELDNRRLRDEVGELTISDSTKPHAIQVRTNEDHSWKWRVWMPEGMTLRLLCKFGDVPRTGVPTGVRDPAILLNGGESWFSVKVKRDSENRWMAYFTTSSGSQGHQIDERAIWFNSETASWMGTVEGVTFQTRIAAEPDQPFVLLRQREAHAHTKAEIDKLDVTPAGFIIWLERQ